MTPRRQQTNIPQEQPVRVYKTIAVSFLLLTLVLVAVMVFMSAKRAVIVVESQTEPIDATGTIVVTAVPKEGEILGVVTTTLVSLTHTFVPGGSQEEPATATGTVTLYNKSNSAQPLVATTRLETPEGILFRLKNTVTVPAFGTVSAEVYADKKGSGGDIGPSRFTIPGLKSDARRLAVYGESMKPMQGGMTLRSVLTSDDLQKEEKVFVNLAETAGKKILTTLFPGKESFFVVVQHAVDTSANIGDIVSTPIVMTGKATVLGVFYAGSDLKNHTASLLMKKNIDDIQTIEPSAAAPAVTLGSYDIMKAQALLTVVVTGSATVNPESKQLAKSMFFGKTKDEVSRYVQSLDHVHGVTVTFTPSWIQTVPHVSDHVSVIVKNVQ